MSARKGKCIKPKVADCLFDGGVGRESVPKKRWPVSWLGVTLLGIAVLAVVLPRLDTGSLILSHRIPSQMATCIATFDAVLLMCSRANLKR